MEHSEDSTDSLVDVDSINVGSVSSDYESQSTKTDNQAGPTEAGLEAEEGAAGEQSEEEYQRIKRQAKAQAHEAKIRVLEAKAKASAEVKKDVERISDEAKSAGEDLQRNADNPVVVGNAVVVAALSAALGFGAYRKYSAGELTWKLVGAWAGVVGLFAVGDYYVSRYVLQHCYSGAPS